MPARSPPRLTAPISPQSFTMPAGDRGRLHQHQRVLPPRPPPSQADPEQSVRWAKASIRTTKDRQLMVQGKTLKEEVSTQIGRSEAPRSCERRRAPAVEWPSGTRASTILLGCDFGEAHPIESYRLSRPIRLPIPVTRLDVLNLVSRGSSPHVLAVTTVEMTVRSAHSWYASLVWLKGNVFPTVAFMLICPVSISLTWRGESRRSLVPPPVPGQ